MKISIWCSYVSLCLWRIVLYSMYGLSAKYVGCVVTWCCHCFHELNVFFESCQRQYDLSDIYILEQLFCFNCCVFVALVLAAFY